MRAAPFLAGVAVAGAAAAVVEAGATPSAVASSVAALLSVACLVAARHRPAGKPLDLRDALAIELERSRRHGRRFTLIRSLPTGRAADHLPGLVSKLRAIDLAWADGVHLYVLLPEATRAFAHGLVQRLQQELPDAVPADVATAVFPDDGLTSGALLAALDAVAVDTATEVTTGDVSPAPAL